MNELLIVMPAVVTTAGITLPLGWCLGRRRRAREVADLAATVERQQQTAEINDLMHQAIMRNVVIGVRDRLHTHGRRPT